MQRAIVISISISISTAMLAPSVQADEKKYTLADLKALVAEKAHKEAFVHIGDIPPSKRKGEWLEVAATAAGGTLATLDANDGSTVAAIDQIDRDYPQLLKSSKYTTPRAELGLKGIEGCFGQTSGYWGNYGLDNCMGLAVRFVDNSGGDRVLALKVAKIARRSMHSASALPLFVRAVGPNHPAACKDEDLRLAVVSGLDAAPRKPNAAQATAIMGTCWSDVKDAVVEAFEGSSKDSNVWKNTCDTLLAKKMISGLYATLCTKQK